MPLIKVPYDIKSNNPLVSFCLTEKVKHVKNTIGIGPLSCCAAMKFTVGTITDVYFGNSQLKNHIIDGLYKNDYIKCHGEASAIMSVLDLLGDTVDIAKAVKEVYIEMSPCAARCAGLLSNLNPALNIYYSFDHPTEVSAWQSAAKTLCK